MAHLTFIRFAAITNDGSISVKSARQLYLLAKIIVEKFGKPQVLYTSGEDGGLQSAKIVNLACSAHGIHESSALGSKASKRDTSALIDILEHEAEQGGYSHLVLVASHEAIRQILPEGHVSFGNSCTLSATKWKDILEAYEALWSPFYNETEDPEELRLLTDKLFNTPCSADENLVIERTLLAFETI